MIGHTVAHRAKDLRTGRGGRTHDRSHAAIAHVIPQRCQRHTLDRIAEQGIGGVLIGLDAPLQRQRLTHTIDQLHGPTRDAAFSRIPRRIAILVPPHLSLNTGIRNRSGKVRSTPEFHARSGHNLAGLRVHRLRPDQNLLIRTQGNRQRHIGLILVEAFRDLPGQAAVEGIRCLADFIDGDVVLPPRRVHVGQRIDGRTSAELIQAGGRIVIAATRQREGHIQDIKHTVEVRVLPTDHGERRVGTGVGQKGGLHFVSRSHQAGLVHVIGIGIVPRVQILGVVVSTLSRVIAHIGVLVHRVEDMSRLMRKRARGSARRSDQESAPGKRKSLRKRPTLSKTAIRVVVVVGHKNGKRPVRAVFQTLSVVELANVLVDRTGGRVPDLAEKLAHPQAIIVRDAVDRLVTGLNRVVRVFKVQNEVQRMDWLDIVIVRGVIVDERVFPPLQALDDPVLGPLNDVIAAGTDGLAVGVQDHLTVLIPYQCVPILRARVDAPIRLEEHNVGHDVAQHVLSRILRHGAEGEGGQQMTRLQTFQEDPAGAVTPPSASTEPRFS